MAAAAAQGGRSGGGGSSGAGGGSSCGTGSGRSGLLDKVRGRSLGTVEAWRARQVRTPSHPRPPFLLRLLGGVLVWPTMGTLLALVVRSLHTSNPGTSLFISFSEVYLFLRAGHHSFLG